MTKLLCIYHANCADGFGAAWAVRNALGDAVEFHAATYQDPPPDVAGRHVLIVDFSYKRPVLLDMASRARSIVILDHHKSAAEDLAGFRPPAPYEAWGNSALPPVEGDDEPIAALFDMNRSGAVMAWDFFHPNREPPMLLQVVQDRDLWRFNMPWTRGVQTVLYSHPYDFAVWDVLASRCDEPELRQQMVAEGEAIDRKHLKDCEELINVTRRFMIIGGHRVPVCNLPYTMSSDVGHKLCSTWQGDMEQDGVTAKMPPFAACYWDTEKVRVFSLRSDDRHGGVDVSAIAKLYGGGGHRNAAGFRMPIGWEGESQ